MIATTELDASSGLHSKYAVTTKKKAFELVATKPSKGITKRHSGLRRVVVFSQKLLPVKNFWLKTTTWKGESFQVQFCFSETKLQSCFESFQSSEVPTKRALIFKTTCRSKTCYQPASAATSRSLCACRSIAASIGLWYAL